jgi:enoyl-CoA hydratase/carnithine racemase
MQASLQFCNLTNTPFWKADKYIRQFIGPNPFRAHDVIGAKGSNFLTWSCLHHLSKEYGSLFEPEPCLVEHKESGQNWYPLNHFRPIVNWKMDEEENELLQTIILGALYHMTSIMLHERRADLASMNAIGELCAQFTRGMLAIARQEGFEKINETVRAYHKLIPPAAQTKWYPDEFKRMTTPEWQQLYVNAEHDGKSGVITISRESYNSDVDAELNRAIDWLLENEITRVIVTGDFHLSTQMVGADTNEFYSAIQDYNEGKRISLSWSRTARRLYQEFDISLGFINGKRCLGGMLELMMHCHYLFAVEDATLGMPEVTLPVIPGMEGCHWSFRKIKDEDRKYLLQMLLEAKSVKAKEAVGWLVDFSDTMEKTLQKAWEVMEKGKSIVPMRPVKEQALGIIEIAGVAFGTTPDFYSESPREAISRCIEDSCNSKLEEAIAIQAKHSASFMLSPQCRSGKVGIEYNKIIQN